MSVVLIFPNFNKPGTFATSTPPLGVATLAAILEHNNIDCEVIDPAPLGLSKQEVVKRAANYDVIGLSILTPQRFEAMDLIKAIKKANPNAMIVVGGPHVTHIDKLWMQKVPETDVIVRGEGEKPFLQIVKGIPLKTISNVTFREHNKIIRNPILFYVKHIDSLPFLAYDKFPLEKYTRYDDIPKNIKVTRQVGMITSRGCPFRCLFCSSPAQFGWFWRGQSSKRVVDEIEYVVNNFGVNYIRFFDDHFTFNPKRTLEICEQIKRRKLDVHWRCESRVDMFNEELAKRMSEAGCHEVEFGVESGSQRLIDIIGKRITIDQVKKAVSLCRKYGINPKGFFIVGLLGETFYDLLLTARVMNLFDYVGISRLEIYPGSRIWFQMKRAGKWNDMWWFERTKPARVTYDKGWNKVKDLEWLVLMKLRKIPINLPHGKWIGPKYF